MFDFRKIWRALFSWNTRYEIRPFALLQACYPIGILTKKTQDEFWVVIDLSYPKGKSINDYILKDEFCLSMLTVGKVVSFIQELWQGCYFSKINIENAFRLIPVAPLQ